MYGGMIVDTNHFANRTGTRTFEAAAKLREFGADTILVNKWLKQDLERVRFINAQISEAQVIEDKFIITTYNDIVMDPVVLAQVANQALNIEGIEAAFAIGKVSEAKSRVSARSHGDLNVQFFMESFNGGGHLTSAATELEKSPLDIASEIISKLQLEYGGNEGNMKVILLEDVKGRGKKDEVIEVASGYAQFLLTQKKAIKASDDNISALEQKRKDELLQAQQHLEIMKSLKAEIDHKHITLPIQVGKDGKLFGAITTKHIVDMFEKTHGLLLDKKKIEVSSEINSVGIYTVTVHLHKSVNAQFEVHVENQKVS
jgi:ribosomal protein L9